MFFLIIYYVKEGVSYQLDNYGKVNNFLKLIFLKKKKVHFAIDQRGKEKATIGIEIYYKDNVISS